MELEFFFSSIFVTSLLFVFIILRLNTARTPNLPPGPWKLPIVGNLHHLVGSLPHHRLRDLAKIHGPLMHLQLGELSTVVVSSAEFAEEFMKTHDVIFASRPHILAMEILFYNSASIAFSPYGDYWRGVKKICTRELLTMKRVQSFRSIREEEVSNLIDWIASNVGSPINFTTKVHLVSNGITLRAAFGMKPEDGLLIRSIMQETLESLSGFSIVDLFPSIGMLQWITGIRSRLEKLHQEIDRILEKIISEHKQAKATGKSEDQNKDLVDVLLKVQEDDDVGFHLTTDNIKAVLWDIFLAGTDTPSTTVNWAMVELMKHPRLMKKTQAEVRKVFNRNRTKADETGISEMKFLKAVIKETLRLHPPGALLAPRECRERCEIKGFEIPAKTKVIVNAWAIGRDPEYWREAESFFPERFLDSTIDYRGTDFVYIPFGAGRRMCPGISYAMANIELLLAMLLYHFDWKLPDGMTYEELDMTEKFGISIERKDELKIVPILYHSSSVS